MYENSLLYFVNLFEDCSTTSLYCMYLLLQTPQLPLTSMIPLTLTSVPMRGINISCRTCQSLLNNQSSHNAFLQGFTLRRLPLGFLALFHTIYICMALNWNIINTQNWYRWEGGAFSIIRCSFSDSLWNWFIIQKWKNILVFLVLPLG